MLLYLPSNGQDLSKGDLADNVSPEESTALLFLCSQLRPGLVILGISPRILLPCQGRCNETLQVVGHHSHSAQLPQKLSKLWQQKKKKKKKPTRCLRPHWSSEKPPEEAEESAWWSLHLCLCHLMQAADFCSPVVDLLLLGPT